MADETLAAAQPAGAPEPVQQSNLDRATSEESIDSMLASIPGLDRYFGTESSDNKKKDEPVKEKASASPGESQTAGEPVITDEILSAEKQEKEASAEAEEKTELPEAVRSRIDRLTAARRDLEDSVNDLKRQNTELKSKLSDAGARGPVQASAQNPLGDIGTYEALDQKFLDAQAAKSWALRNLDGGRVEVNRETGETRELSGQEVKELLALSEELLTRHIPQRKGYLDARVDFDRQADSYYPDLKKPDSELSKTVTEWVRIFPEVLRFPDFRMIIADAMVGQKLRFGRLAAAKNGNSGSRTPTLAAPSPSASARVPAKSVLSKDLLDRMATDRSALDVFSESLIGTGLRKK
jgi:small-conductance mechanosensitive channel